MNAFSKKILFLIFFSSSVNAGVFQLTPPPSLTIDSQNINSGVFTLKTYSGFDETLKETVILNSGNADDISHAATMGSNESMTLLNYSETFPIVQFDYSFNATVPDLATIDVNVLSATTDFIISLPFSSNNTGFFEVIDSTGKASFHKTAATLDSKASGSTNIDLFGNGSVFATFGKEDVVISASQFQDHGTVITTTPIPAAIWLFGSGLAGLMGMKKKRAKFTSIIT